MFFRSTDIELENKFNVIIQLIETILNTCTAKQSEVIHLKLMGYSEAVIAEKLSKTQSTVSQHSSSAGWHSINKAVEYYENFFRYGN